jgi:processive 1,2-diacylglycerol beta-glucosyltransferase
VLIVSASAGNGHLRAGEALKAAVRLRYPAWRVEHLDVLTLAPRWVRLAYGGGFELLAARAPRVWGGIYRWADGPEDDRARWATLAERTVFRAFRRLLLHGRWDLCIGTHFLPAQLAAGRAGMPPFALVVTDHTLHRYWAQPRVRRYYVANQTLAQGIRARIGGAVVEVTGIPVDPKFAQSISQADARQALGLNPDQPVIALMGGGLGLGIEDNLDALLGCRREDIQIVVICGRNLGVRARLEQRGLPARVHVIGYVHAIEGVLGAADVVITKPGGLTTSEALALGRPLVLTRPLPGHEQGNITMLEATGAACFAASAEALRETVNVLFEEPARLRAMATAAQAAGRPGAAADILRHLEPDLQQAAAA